MKQYNMTLMFSTDGKRLLFCRRMKDPYISKLNFPGGRLEEGEQPLGAALRELQEETGIDGNSITPLKRIMDFIYYDSQREVQVFACRMVEDKEVRQEEGGNPLVWVDLDEVDLNDLDIFAGDGNVRHCVLMAQKHMDDGKA